MEKHKHHKSTLSRVEAIKEITQLHYEEGNNSRCYKSVWRFYVYPKYRICYRTYLNYLGISPESDQDDQQPCLFDFEDPCG